MAEKIKGLAEDPNTGQRYAWSGYDWVPVPRDFDPRESAFVGGLTREVNRFGAGIKQLIAAIKGDDAALFSLATEQEMQDWAQRVRSRNAPIAGFAGSLAPYVAAGAGVGGAAARVGASAAQAAAAGVATDAAIAGLSYGSPSERALNTAMALAGGAGGYAISRAMGLAGDAVSARRAGITPELEAVPAGGAALAGGVDLPGPMAGGTAVGDEFARSFGGRVVDRLMKAVRPEETRTRLRQTQNLRHLARKHRIKLHPSAATGSRMWADWEAGMQTDPFSAAPWIRRQGLYNNRLEWTFKKALGLEGWKGPVNREFIRAAEDQVADGFAEIAEKSAGISTDDVVSKAQKAANENKVGWTKGIEETFNRQLNLIRKEGDTMTGRAAWTMQRQFAQAAAESRTAAEQRMLYSVADALEASIVDASEGAVDPAVLQNLRKRYRLLKRLAIRKAVSDTDGVRYRSALSAMQDEFDEYRRGTGFEYGASENALMKPMNDLFEVLRVGQLFAPSRGDSGTATRLAFQNFPSNPLSMAIRQAAAETYYQLNDAAGKY